YLYGAAYLLWFSGLCLHLVMMYFFTKKYILNFKIEKVFPSYFIVYVGIVCGSVTSPAFGFISLGRFLFWFGFIAYLILLPLILYRVLVIKRLPEPAFPTIAILSAPASLCLAGYLSSFQDKSLNLIVFLSLLSLSMFFLVIMYIPGIIRLKFYPSYSALTFPFVITAIAMKGAYTFLAKIVNIRPFLYLAKFMEFWAITMILYVFIRYAIFIFSEPDIRRT
ncbi:MAG: exfoliative toxin, partial [Tepidanaerobacteraceae bacterium]|nr:exfoliative toxin [Tepidanaerobacteraceae bacterium]